MSASANNTTTIDLTADQIKAVRAPSTKYKPAAYQAVITDLQKKKSVKARGKIETLFPGVKPQHVAFMLKRLLGDDKSFTVTIDATYGVTLLKNA